MIPTNNMKQWLKLFPWIIIMVTVLLIGDSTFSLYGEKRPITIEDMHRFQNVGNPVISPDGKRIAFTVDFFCEKEKKKFSDIYVMDSDGKNIRRLTTHPEIESKPSWNPSSDHLAFSAERDGDKRDQLYLINIYGGEAVRLTNLESGAEDPLWSPDGRWIAFYSKVGRLYSDEFQKELDKVRFLTHLRYYHVKNWDDGKRKRIFVIPADGAKAPIQLTNGPCADEGDRGMAWAPDSKEIAFFSNRTTDWWNNINTDIYTVSVPAGKITQITGNAGPDKDPAYSPDGKSIAFLSIFTFNYESEHYKVVVKPRGVNPLDKKETDHALTCSLDRDVTSFRWSPDSKKIYFLYGNEGLYHMKSVPRSGGTLRDVLTGRHIISDWEIDPLGKTIIAIKNDDVTVPDIYSYRGTWKQLTAFNDSLLAELVTQPVEEIWVKSVDGAHVQAWIIKPTGFEDGKKYPMILSIHGGPHGMSTIAYRFDFQLYAANGFVIVYANPRASLGYGEKFSRAIWEDWGGRCYHDLMAIVDAVISKGYVDEKKMGVMGGSFGGYMTNWIIGHNQRFAAAVSVAGLSNLTSFYGTTDEQFFAEAEFKGVPWQKKNVYIEQSPLWYAENFKTPTLVVHGENDFRVRTEQGEQMFTALQKQGVPSVYAWFPDEGHGVRKPMQRKLYYKMIIDWFGHFLQGKPSTYLDMAAR